MQRFALVGLLVLLSSSAHAQFAPIQRAGTTSIDYMLLDRELTLDSEVVEMSGRLQVLHLSLGGFGLNATGLALGVAYGIADVLEIWGEPVVLFDPETELGLNLGASVRAVDGEVIDMAPSVAVPLNVTAPGDTVSSMSIGLDTRIALGPVVSLFLLHGLVTPVFAADDVLIMANVGLGLQPSEIVGLRFETRPFAILASDGDVLHYGDVIPFGMDFLVTAESLDLFAGISFFDLENAGDIYSLTFGAMGRFGGAVDR